MKQTKTEILEKYYQLWKNGINPSDIQKELDLPDKKFIALTQDFLAYCRHHSNFDEEDTPLSKQTVDLTDDIKKEFIRYALTGLAYDKISQILNVSMVTILDHWFKKNPEFKRDVDNAIMKADANVQMALHERAIGGIEAPTTTVTTTSEIIKNEKGEKEEVTQKVESKSVRFIAGDVNAQKFWLINRKPDEFSLDGIGNRGHSKGKILDAIDELLNTEDADKLDAQFEEG